MRWGGQRLKRRDPGDLDQHVMDLGESLALTSCVCPQLSPTICAVLDLSPRKRRLGNGVLSESCKK